MSENSTIVLWGLLVMFIIFLIIISSDKMFGLGALKEKRDALKQKKQKQAQEQAQEQADTARFDKNLQRLEKLGKLYKDGIITKEEFEDKRKKYKL
jgi:competence protein ComGC